MSVVPTTTAGEYNVSASSLVGAVEIEGTPFVVQPKIGDANVLFMAAYTAGLDEQAFAEVAAFEQGGRLDEVILRALCLSVERLLVDGIVEDYVDRSETLPTVRGRIDIAGQLRVRPGLAFPLENQFTELTSDTPLNRYLLDTLLLVSRMRVASGATRRNARRLADGFRGVRSDAGPHRPPPIDSRHSAYRTVVHLAAIVRNALALALGDSKVRAPGFIVDMNVLFEDFMTAALARAIRVTEHDLVAQGTGCELFLDAGQKHPLKPDITLWKNGACTSVADVKYKDVDSKGIRNEDLYQVAAYAAVLDLNEAWLLYPGKHAPTTLDLIGDTLKVHAVSIDVSLPPSDLLDEIGMLAKKLTIATP
jgi:5-methylcytosine-specific restriction enzyme subunit McrC